MTAPDVEKENIGARVIKQNTKKKIGIKVRVLFRALAHRYIKTCINSLFSCLVTNGARGSS